MIVGNTYRFKLTATKDGATWDITGATVKLFLRGPSGAVIEKTGNILSAAAGTAYYDSDAADIDTAGNWVRSWEITQGSIVQESDPIIFYVAPGQG